jgi:uncharacterized MAPEG superfamily protein
MIPTKSVVPQCSHILYNQFVNYWYYVIIYSNYIVFSMEDQPLLSQERMTNNSTTDFSLNASEQQESTNSSSNNIITMPSAIDYLNEYKGKGVPDTIVPVLGAVIGIITPIIFYYIFTALSIASDDVSTINNVIVVLKSMIVISLLFLLEFIFGIMARSKYAKAGFSPAAIQASGNQPFEIIEANRIHQNHIESACIYIPASLSATAAGANTTLLVATTISWVICRFTYRYGYGQHHNPLWRLVGTVSSLTQSFICIGLFVYATIKNDNE